MMRPNRELSGYPVIGWISRIILLDLFYLPFMYQAENPPCEAKEETGMCPGAVSHGPFHGAFILNHRGGRRAGWGLLRKVGQTSKGGKERDSAQPSRTADGQITQKTFSLSGCCSVKGKRSEWKTSSHPEMWERSASAKVIVAVSSLTLHCLPFHYKRSIFELDHTITQ